uniref:Uncharacterized protein n=1 Tax=Vespula pensylvanica TaxID=30213 RepID=A0A834UAZ8_VESPE|nr:hypothetical protein H0235_006914 [Vespula pensylvanica]
MLSQNRFLRILENIFSFVKWDSHEIEFNTYVVAGKCWELLGGKRGTLGEWGGLGWGEEGGSVKRIRSIGFMPKDRQMDLGCLIRWEIVQTRLFPVAYIVSIES